jgi:hypothetical protein
MKLTNSSILYIGALFTSLLLLFTLAEFVSYSRLIQASESIDLIKETEPPVKIETQRDPFARHAKLISCFSIDGNKCSKNEVLENVVITTSKKENHQFATWFFSAPIVIKAIYLLLAILFSLPLFFIMKSKILGKNYLLNNKDFYTIDSCLSTIPMLGILGTFYSIAVALYGTNASSAGNQIISNFFNAILTSIIGISFYVISSFLRRFLYPKLEQAIA